MLFFPLFKSRVLLYEWGKSWVFLSFPFLGASAAVRVEAKEEGKRGRTAARLEKMHRHRLGLLDKVQLHNGRRKPSGSAETLGSLQQGLMEPRAQPPGMAPKCPRPLSDAVGHEMSPLHPTHELLWWALFSRRGKDPSAPPQKHTNWKAAGVWGRCALRASRGAASCPKFWRAHLPSAARLSALILFYFTLAGACLSICRGCPCQPASCEPHGELAELLSPQPFR